jgi:hypothetical protein
MWTCEAPLDGRPIKMKFMAWQLMFARVVFFEKELAWEVIIMTLHQRRHGIPSCQLAL